MEASQEAGDLSRPDLTIGAAVPRDRPVPRPEADVRFGLVLYGGVSLAIYIYGVVLEFWRLMRASEGREQNAYSELLSDANVTASVDVISGTSAGGINGIVLAKAIATGGDLAAVDKIWLDDADFAALIRETDEESPRSLLKTDFFEKVMLGGLQKLDAPTHGGRLANVLDLFAPGTRIRPWHRPFRTGLDGVIDTQQYRKVFRLKLRTLDRARDDFTKENNAILAKVARSTSAFPGAFEPQTISRNDDPNGLTFEPEEPDSAEFSDGGILHNKPFTEAIDAILGRRSDTGVRRWLVSVEPDPEEPPERKAKPPEVDEVIAKALFGIPSYQSIASDLERLDAHRTYAARQRDLIARLEVSLAQGQLEPDSPAYREERLAQLCADLAGEIASFADLPQPAEEELEAELNAAVESGTLTEAADFSYERRRIYFLLKRLGERRPKGSPPDELRELSRRLWEQFGSIGDLLRQPLEDWGDVGHWEGPLSEHLEGVRRATLEICAEIDAQMPGQRPTFVEAFENYPHWDKFLVPTDPLHGYTRDKINLARVSPGDAQFVRKTPEKKLAGDSLGHFGGFLERRWRENDIFWGRLDAAEQIVRIVGAELPSQQLDRHIEKVQSEIVRKVHPGAPANYRTWLQNDYKLEPESLDDLDPQVVTSLVLDSAAVARNMLRRLGAAEHLKLIHYVYRLAGRALGAVLSVLRWPATAIAALRARSREPD